MLAKNPEERITAEEALNSEWLSAANSTTMTASKDKIQEV